MLKDTNIYKTIIKVNCNNFYLLKGKFLSFTIIDKFYSNLLVTTILTILILTASFQTPAQNTGSTMPDPYGSGVHTGRSSSPIVPPTAFSGNENPDTYSYSMNQNILSLPGRGLDVNLTLFYNSNLYRQEYRYSEGTPQMFVSGRGDSTSIQQPSLGFALSYGRFIHHNSRVDTINVPTGGGGICENRYSSPYAPQRFTFTDSTGASRRFANGISYDSSNIRFRMEAGGPVITYSDGTKVFFTVSYEYQTGGDSNTVRGADGSVCIVTNSYYDRVYSPTKIIDVNGNYISINYTHSTGPRIAYITDTLGRKITFHYGGSDSDLMKITIPSFEANSERTVVRFYYENKNITYSFQNQTRTSNARVLKKIYLPGGSNVGWNYEYSSYGMIYRVERLYGIQANPSTGDIENSGQMVAYTEYDYPIVPSNLQDVPKYYHRTDGWLKNLSNLNDFETRQHSFDVQLEHVGYYRTVATINAPDSTVFVIRKRHYTARERFDLNAARDWTVIWDDGLIQEQKIIKNSLVYSTTNNSWSKTPGGARLNSIKHTNDIGQTVETNYAYAPNPELDTNNNYKGVFDNIVVVSDKGFNGEEVRRTEISYETNLSYTDRWLLKLPKTVKIFEGGSTLPASQIDYTYDTSSLASCPGIIKNDAVPIERGNVTSVTTYVNAADTSTGKVETKTEYNIAGKLIKKIDPLNNITTIDYSDRFGVTDGEARSNIPPAELNGQFTYAFGTSITNALGHTNYLQINYNTGSIVDGEDINGVVSSFFYIDALNRPTQTIIASNIPTLKSQITTIYDDSNLKVTTTSDLVEFNDNLLKSEMLFDVLGRVTESREYESNNFIAVQTEYDLLGRPYRQSNPFRPTEINANNPIRWSISLFDPMGRMREMESPDGAKIKTSYEGNRTLVTDQAGKQRIGKTNALGQLTDVWEITSQDSLTVPVAFPGQVLSAGYHTSYQYDVLNNLKTVIQGEQIRSFQYDSLSRLKQATNPESGTKSYTYDTNSNLKTSRDDRGIKTVYDYDVLNRHIKRCYRDIGIPAPLGMTTCVNNNETAEANTTDVVYTYENTTVTSLKGLLTKVANGTSTTEYTSFDNMGRVRSHKQTTDGIAYNTAYDYFLSGALKQETYPSTRVIKNVIDSKGDLRMVQSKKNGNAEFWNYAQNFSYTAAGSVSSMQLGNGKWESTQFNSRLQPTQIALGTVQNGFDKLKLNYDYGTAQNNGNVQSQTNIVPTEIRNGTTYAGFTATQTYIYDSLNRLKSAEETIPNQALSWKQTFKYDRYGNRNFDTTNAGDTTTLDPNCVIADCNPAVDTQNNKLIGHVFDNAGNAKTDAGGRAFTYDGENKQIKVQIGSTVIGEYSYDGEGKRVRKYVPTSGETTIFVYNALGKLVLCHSNIDG